MAVGLFAMHAATPTELRLGLHAGGVATIIVVDRDVETDRCTIRDI